MASSLQNLSNHSHFSTDRIVASRIGIVTAEWNKDITGALEEGAVEYLKGCGIPDESIVKLSVPGTFELILGGRWLAENEKIDAVLCLGCVIQGDTPHFDYICQAAAYGIAELNIKYGKPVIFGVITTLTHQQAVDRAGGVHGNKGIEAAATAVQMLISKP